MPKAFLCHSSKDSDFVVQVGAYLSRHIGVFTYEEHQKVGSFLEVINLELAQRCDIMVIFHRDTVSDYQRKEIEAVDVDQGERTKAWKVFIVPIPNADLDRPRRPVALTSLKGETCIWPDGDSPIAGLMGPLAAAQRAPNPWRIPAQYAAWVAQRILEHLDIPWRAADDLPANPHLFDYEKDIIDFFTRRRRLGDQLWQGPGKQDAARPRDPKADHEMREKLRMREKLLYGCPAQWPSTERFTSNGVARENPLRPENVGQTDGGKVVVAALSTFHTACDTATGVWRAENCMLAQQLAFDEARPSSTLHFPVGESLQVAILVAGGIAPGINAVIDGIVQRHWRYLNSSARQYSLKVLGLINGFHAFDVPIVAPKVLAEYDATSESVRQLPTESAQRANDGGCFLGTSRMPKLMEEGERGDELSRMVKYLRDTGVDILYVIGGDGSMKAAHALWSAAKADGVPLSVVAVPKTMDNDILWVWQSFGFLSAVEKGREVIELLHTEVSSNPRLCVVQLFGSDSGFVVSHAVLASATGQCDAALIPEVPFSMKRLALHVKKRIHGRGPIPYGLVVMAETAIPLDAEEYCDWEDVGLSIEEKKQIRTFCEMRRTGRRIQGQTDDHLRSAGLKIVSRALARLLREMRDAPPTWANHLRVMANEPRHVLRSIRPSCTDIIMGQRLGTLAVDNAMAGFTDFMISQWLTEYVLVPLKLVVLGRKRIPKSGIFWTSVRAKTNQETHMYSQDDLRRYDPKTYEAELLESPQEVGQAG